MSFKWSNYGEHTAEGIVKATMTCLVKFYNVSCERENRRYVVLKIKQNATNFKLKASRIVISYSKEVFRLNYEVKRC